MSGTPPNPQKHLRDIAPPSAVKKKRPKKISAKGGTKHLRRVDMRAQAPATKKRPSGR